MIFGFFTEAIKHISHPSNYLFIFRLPVESNSLTPNESPGERALRLSAKERRAQDWKHLDDITAARHAPLNHSPALLLSLEESLNLQIEQKNSYEVSHVLSGKYRNIGHNYATIDRFSVLHKAGFTSVDF